MLRISFLLSMSEGEWQKDQGDDRHQVGRIGEEGCSGLHRMRLNKLRELS